MIIAFLYFLMIRVYYISSVNNTHIMFQEWQVGLSGGQEAILYINIGNARIFV